MDYVKEITNIIADTLVLGNRADDFDASTQLIGALPEFDSMAVVSIITAIEDELGCVFDDEEITAEVFETIGSLSELVASKLEE